MTEQRKGDLQARTWFRTDRFRREQSLWYFTTREGTDEGPFEQRSHAEQRLEEYIRIMNSGWLTRGDAVETTLALEPLTS